MLSPEERALRLLPCGPLFFDDVDWTMLRVGMVKAIRAAVVEEREAILKYAKFLRKEHCATKGEARGMELIIGGIESRSKDALPR